MTSHDTDLHDDRDALIRSAFEVPNPEHGPGAAGVFAALDAAEATRAPGGGSLAPVAPLGRGRPSVWRAAAVVAAMAILVAAVVALSASEQVAISSKVDVDASTATIEPAVPASPQSDVAIRHVDTSTIDVWAIRIRGVAGSGDGVPARSPKRASSETD